MLPQHHRIPRLPPGRPAHAGGAAPSHSDLPPIEDVGNGNVQFAFRALLPTYDCCNIGIMVCLERHNYDIE